MDDHRRIEVSRTVDAPAERVFALLVDPSRHSEPDGSGMVRGSPTPGPVTTTDQRFRMAMHRDERGHYETDNLVTTYEPDQAIRWATTYPDHASLGLTWTYTLTPDGHRTLVTHTYDWSGVTDPELLPVFPRVSREQMAGTLDRSPRRWRPREARCGWGWPRAGDEHVSAPDEPYISPIPSRS